MKTRLLDLGMDGPPIQIRRGALDTVDDSTAFGQWVIDEMLERYISWREECVRSGSHINDWPTRIVAGDGWHMPGM